MPAATQETDAFEESTAGISFASSPAYARGHGLILQTFFSLSYVGMSAPYQAPEDPPGTDHSHFFYGGLWPNGSDPVGIIVAGRQSNRRFVQRLAMAPGSTPIPFTGDDFSFGVSIDYQFMYLMVTSTGLDFLPPGIHTVRFSKALAADWIGHNIPVGSQTAVYLLDQNGTRIRLSAPDNIAGYTGALPSGIISQTDGGDGTWHLTFNSTILFGAARPWRPQIVFPANCFWGTNVVNNPDATPGNFLPGTLAWCAGTISGALFHTYPVPGSLPPIFSRQVTSADFQGFPSAYAYDPGADPFWTAQPISVNGTV